MKFILEKKYGLLTFSLLSGLGYFILIMMLISGLNYSYLLGIFFFPAIVCGSALIIIKSIKSFLENGEEQKVKRIIGIHYALIAISFALLAVFLIF